jgi:hypothetical protein
MTREVLDREPSGLSIEGHMFTTLFMDTARQYEKAVNTSLTSEERTRREVLINKHDGLDWRPVLELFFQSDIGHVTRDHHSLRAFLNSYNLFLLRIPVTVFATAPRSAAPHSTTSRMKRSGWRKPLD